MRSAGLCRPREPSACGVRRRWSSGWCGGVRRGMSGWQPAPCRGTGPPRSCLRRRRLRRFVCSAARADCWWGRAGCRRRFPIQCWPSRRNPTASGCGAPPRRSKVRLGHVRLADERKRKTNTNGCCLGICTMRRRPSRSSAPAGSGTRSECCWNTATPCPIWRSQWGIGCWWMAPGNGGPRRADDRSRWRDRGAFPAGNLTRKRPTWRSSRRWPGACRSIDRSSSCRGIASSCWPTPSRTRQANGPRSGPETLCRNRCGAMPTAGCEWNRSCRWPPRSRASRRRIPVRSSSTTRSSG